MTCEGSAAVGGGEVGEHPAATAAVRCESRLESGEQCFEAPGHDVPHGFFRWLRVKRGVGHMDFADEDGEWACYVVREMP